MSRNISDNKLIDVLCFVSCVALMMNGWYVDYSHQEKLSLEMPIKQYELKLLEIQSKLLMANFNQFKLFRLHHTIPHRLAVDYKATASRKDVREKELPSSTESERNEEEPHPKKIGDEIEATETRMEKRQPLCLPLKHDVSKRKWNSEELEILHDISRKKRKSLDEEYEEFRTECMSKNIPFRTKKAFQLKLIRL